MFELHERLESDTELLAEWSLSSVLLMRDAAYPWLILVPARPRLRHLHDLSAADRQTAMNEIARASEALQTLYRPDKINVAALGNVVDQLHIHVIARFRSDPAWPGPVWGAQPPTAYGAAELAETVARLREVLD